MCIISQTISRDFSPRLFASRVARPAVGQFSPQELLDISQQISREYAPNKSTRQSRLVLLAVSPRRLHAYWHIAKRRLTHAPQQNEAAQALTLRIFTEAGAADAVTEKADHDAGNWFDVPVTGTEGQQDIWLPEPMSSHSGMQYRAELGEVHANRTFLPQVVSNAAQTANIATQQMRDALPDAVAQFIMCDSPPASSAGNNASGQGK